MLWPNNMRKKISSDFFFSSESSIELENDECLQYKEKMWPAIMLLE